MMLKLWHHSQLQVEQVQLELVILTPLLLQVHLVLELQVIVVTSVELIVSYSVVSIKRTGCNKRTGG